MFAIFTAYNAEVIFVRKVVGRECSDQ